MRINQTFHYENATIVFAENEAATLLNFDYDDSATAVDVTVEVDGVPSAKYFHVFESEITPTGYNGFIKKFLENPDFRKNFLKEGTWEAAIPYDNHDGVNHQCALEIEKFNSHTELLKHKNYADLKTFGKDRFSRMTRDQVKEQVSTEDFEHICRAFECEEMRISAMRWTARGLHVAHAIRKAEVDEEIAVNTYKP